MHACSPSAGGDNPLGFAFLLFSLTVFFSQFSTCCKFSPLNDCNSFPHSNISDLI